MPERMLLLHKNVYILRQDIDFDRLHESLAECVKNAACETTPQACNRRGAPARESRPWYDAACKAACQRMKHVMQCPQSTAEQQLAAQMRYNSVTHRSKQAWMQRQNDELVEMSSKDSTHFWRAYKSRKRESCPVGLAEQTEAFKNLYGAQPASTHRDLQHQVYLHLVTLMMSACLPTSLQMSCMHASRN